MILLSSVSVSGIDQTPSRRDWLICGIVRSFAWCGYTDSGTVCAVTKPTYLSRHRSPLMVSFLERYRKFRVGSTMTTMKTARCQRRATVAMSLLMTPLSSLHTALYRTVMSIVVEKDLCGLG